MTRSELETAIGRKLGDKNHNEFSTDIIDTELDLSQDRIVLQTRCLKDVQSISIVSGTREYDLPTDYMVTIRVTLSDKPLDPTTKKTLDFYSGESWVDLEGTPNRYYIDMLDPDTKQIGFDNKPQGGDAGTDNCKHYYVVKPASLTLSTSVPFNSHGLMAPYHMVLVHDVVQSLLQDREMTAETLKKIQFHQRELQDFESKIVTTFKNAANKQLRLRGGRYAR